MKQSNWNDLRIELIIGNLLRAGVATAGSVVFVGAVIYLARHHGEAVNYNTFQGKVDRSRISRRCGPE